MATEVKIKLVGVCNVCIYSCPSWNIATSSNLEKRFVKCSLSCLYSSTVMKNTSFYSPLARFWYIKCHRTVWNVPLHQPWRFDKDTGWLSSTLHNTAPLVHPNFPAQTEELHRYLYLELPTSVWIDSEKMLHHFVLSSVTTAGDWSWVVTCTLAPMRCCGGF